MAVPMIHVCCGACFVKNALNNTNDCCVHNWRVMKLREVEEMVGV